MIKLSFFNLFRRKTRTFLSIVGIAIGVAAIIVLVSIVDGFTQDFNNLIGEYKAISVLEKNAQDQTLSRVSVSYQRELEALPGVKAVIPELFVIPETIDGEPTSIASLSPPSVYGFDADTFFANGFSGWVGSLEKGVPLSSSRRGEVLIGKKIVEDYKKFVGSPIKINGKTFRVAGVFETNSELVSSIIAMNIEDARELSPLDSDKVNSFSVYLVDPTKDSLVADLIELKFSDSLEAFTQSELSSQVEGIVGNLRLLAVVVALISSVVAGIGITNTILMSVFERFKEIGTLKAIGWTNWNVIKMILYESLFWWLFGYSSWFWGWRINLFFFRVKVLCEFEFDCF